MLKAPMFFIVFLGSRTGADRSEPGGCCRYRYVESGWNGELPEERSAHHSERSGQIHRVMTRIRRRRTGVAGSHPKGAAGIGRPSTLPCTALTIGRRSRQWASAQALSLVRKNGFRRQAGKPSVFPSSRPMTRSAS
jgi:hypothetical protein